MEGVTEDDSVMMPAFGAVVKQGRGHGLVGAQHTGDAMLQC
jgi:hypothetical protein